MMKKSEKIKLETSIRIKYALGSKTYEKEFKRYALFGKWYAKNWRKITNIIDIRVKGTY